VWRCDYCNVQMPAFGALECPICAVHSCDACC
jgi:hypothetical protein